MVFQLTIRHILPLYVLPFFSIRWVLNILKLIHNIWGPCDTGLSNINSLILVILEDVGVIEHALGDETAWNGWQVVIEDLATNTFLLVIPQVSNLDNWIAVTQLIGCEIISIELRAIPGLHVSSVVLVEVVQLIIHVDWSLNFTSDLINVHGAIALIRARMVLRLQPVLAHLVVLGRALENLLAQHVEHDANCQENDTEDAEGQHGAHGCGHGPPGWQGLLLELGLLQFLNFVTNPLLFFVIDVHLFLFNNINMVRP